MGVIPDGFDYFRNIQNDYPQGFPPSALFRRGFHADNRHGGQLRPREKLPSVGGVRPPGRHAAGKRGDREHSAQYPRRGEVPLAPQDPRTLHRLQHRNACRQGGRLRHHLRFFQGRTRRPHAALRLRPGSSAPDQAPRGENAGQLRVLRACRPTAEQAHAAQRLLQHRLIGRLRMRLRRVA